MRLRGANNPVLVGGFNVVRRMSFDENTAGGNVIVPANANKQIRVLGLICMTSGACSVRFRSGFAGQTLTGWLPLVAAGNGFVWEVQTVGYHWIETDIGEPLVLELSASVQTGGCIVFDVE